MRLISIALLAAVSMAHAETTRVDESFNGREVVLHVGGTLEIALTENGSTGYRWTIPPEAKRNFAAVLRERDQRVEVPDGPPGRPGVRHLTFEAIKAGNAEIELQYRRSWEKTQPPARTFKLRVAVREAEAYFNDFNGPAGATFREWTSSGYTNSANRAGTVAAGSGPQAVATVEAPNGSQRFLGEFGGPAIVTAPPYDPQHFVRVDETVTLSLRNLKPHARASAAFDLYILKSWDGNNPNYGPDRWKLNVRGGPTLLDTTFSNNAKSGSYDLSLQDYPAAGSRDHAGAAAVNTLGYKFFGDAVYHLTFTFPHSGSTLVLDFSSSLFEGKGVADESWGLDNVRISTDADEPRGRL